MKKSVHEKGLGSGLEVGEQHMRENWWEEGHGCICAMG